MSILSTIQNLFSSNKATEAVVTPTVTDIPKDTKETLAQAQLQKRHDDLAKALHTMTDQNYKDLFKYGAVLYKSANSTGDIATPTKALNRSIGKTN